MKPSQDTKNNIYDLTYGEYVDLVLGDDSVLNLDPSIAADERAKHRQRVMLEFSELSGGKEFEVGIRTNLDQMKLNVELLGLTLAQNVFLTSYSEEAFEFLKMLHVVKKETDYPSTLEEVEAIVGKIKSKLASLQIELAELGSGGSTSNPKPTRRDFIRLLATLIRYTKTGLTFDTNAAVIAELLYQMKREADKTINTSR